MTYKSIHNNAPQHLRSLITPYTPSRNLRSINKDLLVEPKIKKSYGSRSFKYAASTIWNDLPDDIKESDTVDKFKKLLKSFLFRSAFDRD